MGEWKRNRAVVGGLARKGTLVLGAALVSVALAACGGDGDSNSLLPDAVTAGLSSGAGSGADSSGGPPASPGSGRGASTDAGAGAADAGAGPDAGAGAADAGAGPDAGVGSGPGAGASSDAGSKDAGPPAKIASAPGATTLSWTPPTENEDGTPLKLTGYRIYWGQTDDYFPYSVTLDNPGLTRYVVDQLTPAKWYFTATALSDKGESSFSNVIAMQIR